MVDQIGIDPSTPEVLENVEVEQMYIVCPEEIIVWLYSIASQCPAVPCESAVEFD
jgi:hypothetical protein